MLLGVQLIVVEAAAKTHPRGGACDRGGEFKLSDEDDVTNLHVSVLLKDPDVPPRCGPLSPLNTNGEIVVNRDKGLYGLTSPAVSAELVAPLYGGLCCCLRER